MAQAGDSHSQQTLHLQYIGDTNATLPPFEEFSLGDVTLPAGVDESDVSEFFSAFREHSEVKKKYVFIYLFIYLYLDGS